MLYPRTFRPFREASATPHWIATISTPGPTGRPTLWSSMAQRWPNNRFPPAHHWHTRRTAGDSFNSVRALDRNRWAKVRDENSANYDFTGSQLSISPISGELATGGMDIPAGNVIMQYAPLSWDWSADTSLVFVGVPTSRKGDVYGGIVAWHDARHYVAARVDAGGHMSIESCKQTQGNAEVITNIDLGTNLFNPGYLRLSYSGTNKQYSFLVSSNGVAFTNV